MERFPDKISKTPRRSFDCKGVRENIPAAPCPAQRESCFAVSGYLMIKLLWISAPREDAMARRALSLAFIFFFGLCGLEMTDSFAASAQVAGIPVAGTPTLKSAQEIERLLRLLDASGSVEAKIQRPEGQAIPLFTFTRAQFNDYYKKLTAALHAVSKRNSEKLPFYNHAEYTAAYKRLGYSMDATFNDYYSRLNRTKLPEKGITPDDAQAFYFCQLECFASPADLRSALQSGRISRSSAENYLRYELRVAEAREKVERDRKLR